jgi:hypothetical protein
MAHVHVTVDDWVDREIIGESKNRSARVQELLIKGHMAELQKNIAGTEKSDNPKNAVSWIESANLRMFGVS